MALDSDFAALAGDPSQQPTAPALPQAAAPAVHGLDPDFAQLMAPSSDKRTGDQSQPPTAFGTALRGILSPFMGPLAAARALPQVAGQMASGAVAAPVAGYAGMGAAGLRAAGLTSAEPANVVSAVQSALTYQPTSPDAQNMTKALGYLPERFAQGANWAGGKAAEATGSPALGAAVDTGIQGLPMIAGIKPTAAAVRSGLDQTAALLSRPPPLSAESALNRLYQRSQQSTSAAAAAPSLTNASPELRQAISAAAQKNGGAINPDALQRHIQADMLPVRVQLTDGQATQDPVQISVEQNLRGKENSLATRLNGQNQQLVDNLQAIRDNVGPEVFSTNPTEHADTLINAYRAKNDAAQADIATKYKALQDANGGQFPVDGQQLLANATSQLHKALLFDHAPRPIMATLGRLADNGNMSFENFESLRTNLARLQRTSADGNAVAAAGVIRNAMEDLPLAPGAARLKPLADDARAAARTQFQALDADPAYKAAVNESVPADRYVQRFVVNAPRDDVALMRQNLAGDDAAQQTLGVATIDHLRRAASIADNGSGNFTQAGFNRALQNLAPKLQSLVDPKTAETLQNLGDVARYTQFQPRGSFVNNSNTFVSQAARYGTGALEHGMNMAFHGLPVGTIGRGALEHLSTAKMAQQALAPGAGLSRLKPSTGVRPMGAASVSPGPGQISP